jgi:aminoglycoside-2''-adenylyltransferase
MPTDSDLVAIESLGRLLDAAKIGYWLFGGWAVDFWVGRVTRTHEDIDVAAWRRDYDAIRKVLIAHGWTHTPTDQDVVGTRYLLNGALVEFTFLEAGHAGEIVIPIPGNRVVFSMESFGDARRTLRDVTARVIPLSLVREGKARPRPDATEGAKDRADHEALGGATLLA